MKIRLKFVATASLVILLCVTAGYSDDQTAQEYAALMYQALQQEGFTVTDATKGILTSGANEIFQLNLTAGNDYAFCIAGDNNIQEVLVGVIDGSEKVVSGHNSSSWEYKNIAIAKYQPPSSGQYFIAVILEEAIATSSYYFIVAYR